MRTLIVSVLIILANSTQAAGLNSTLAGRGIWWDNPKSTYMLTRLDGASITRVHIMLTHEPDRNVSSCTSAKLPKPRASMQQLKALVKSLREQSKAVIGTVYLPPTKAAMDSLFDENTGAVSALAKQGVDAFELDLEGAWAEHVPCGYNSHEAAFEDFKARAKSLGYPTGITTHTGHLWNGKIPWARADFVSLQAYSKTDNCPQFSNPKCGPGGLQKYGFSKVKNFKGPIIIGLATYSQKWAAHSEQEAMSLALSSVKTLMAENENVRGYSYWSTENLVLKENRANYEFIRNTKDH